MKKLSALVVILILVSLFVISTSCSSPTEQPTTTEEPTTTEQPTTAEPTILRLAGAWPPDDTPSVILDGFAERFNERAGGNYIIEHHNSGSLIALTESLDSVRLGTVELAAWAPGIYGTVDARFTELPFIYKNAAADAAAQVELTSMYDAFITDKFNQKVLFNFTTGGNEIYANKPVKTMADLEGLLMTSFSPTQSIFIEALGGSPVTIPFTDTYTSVQKGVADACITVPNMAVAFGLSDVISYMTRAYCIPGSIVVSINLDTYNSLPKDVQDILIDEALNTRQIANEIMMNGYEEFTQMLRDQGVTVYDLPQAERDAWVAKLKPSNDAVLAEMGDFGIELAELAERVNSQN